MMRALVSHAPGPVEDLVVQDLPVPEPGPGQVRVRVAAAALNFPDVLMVEGGYQVQLPRPFVPGSEVAGSVEAVGDDVDLRVGDVVAGTCLAGGLAEAVVMSASSLAVLQPGTDLRAASAVDVTSSTAYGALVEVGRVQRGDTVLVLGAAGGVGSAAVQLARHLGSRVVAAASSRERLARTGADLLVEYGGGPAALRAALKEQVPEGVDVVLDPVGGPLAEAALRACARGARFVTIGYASGEIPCVPLNLVLLKDVEVRGFDLRAVIERDPERGAQRRREVFRLLATGGVRPDVSEVLPLGEAAAGLRRLADRQAVGKLVVEPWR